MSLCIRRVTRTRRILLAFPQARRQSKSGRILQGRQQNLSVTPCNTTKLIRHAYITERLRCDMRSASAETCSLFRGQIVD